MNEADLLFHCTSSYSRGRDCTNLGIPIYTHNSTIASIICTQHNDTGTVMVQWPHIYSHCLPQHTAGQGEYLRDEETQCCLPLSWLLLSSLCVSVSLLVSHSQWSWAPVSAQTHSTSVSAPGGKPGGEGEMVWNLLCHCRAPEHYRTLMGKFPFQLTRRTAVHWK